MWSKSIEVLNPYESLKEANKVENKIYGDDVERVVNEASKTKQTKKMAYIENGRKTMIIDAIVFAAIGIIFALFGIVGWMVPWLSFLLFFGFIIYATFCFGRWFENKKCKGEKHER